MAKDVKFNIKLNIDGKDHIVEASTDLQHLVTEFSNARTSADKFRDSLIKFNQIGQAFQNAISGIQSITNLLQTYQRANAAQVEVETQLANNMRNTMNAREADI
jgi:hypothetical protein